jgi:TolB-like protein
MTRPARFLLARAEGAPYRKRRPTPVSVPASHSSSGAVFLSYAREDAAAARRLADALGAFEVEVWLDQDELEGGEAWERNIRRQIGECALFLPVISATTQARREAFFRLEWNLADERTRQMAAGMPFLLPVAIDDTPEAEAIVPDSFLRVQWLRLPRGVPSTGFVERVRALLAERRQPPASSVPSATTVRSRRRMWGWLAAAGVFGAGVLAATLWPRRAEPEPTLVAPVGAVQSIAVLPFDNLSDDKENAFFADGVHEDILTSLANLRNLRVVSRTSVLAYRGTTKNLGQIARELGVTYVLEGSVRRAGGRVRVTGQLIDARTDSHVWQQRYERDVEEKDIFAVQSGLAEEIAAALHAALSPEEKARLQRGATRNPAAYELYLQGRAWPEDGFQSMELLTRSRALLEKAVELDPDFAGAWGALGAIYQGLAVRSLESTPLRELAERAYANLERLAPDDPEAWIQLAGYRLQRNDPDRADVYLERAARALPNHGFLTLLLAEADRRHGRAAEALRHYRRAYALDRQHPLIRRNLRQWLLDIRRYDEAAEFERQDPYSDGRVLAQIAFLQRGSTAEMEAWLAAHPEANSELRLEWSLFSGNAAEIIRLIDMARAQQPGGKLRLIDEALYANALFATGQTARGRELAASLLPLARSTDAIRTAFLLVLLGDTQEGLAELEKGRAADRARRGDDTLRHGGWDAAFILAQTGRNDEAVAEFARLLRKPSGLNVHILRHAFTLQPLRGHPAFEALLADPKNNAPLF